MHLHELRFDVAVVGVVAADSCTAGHLGAASPTLASSSMRFHRNCICWSRSTPPTLLWPPRSLHLPRFCFRERGVVEASSLLALDALPPWAHTHVAPSVFFQDVTRSQTSNHYYLTHYYLTHYYLAHYRSNSWCLDCPPCSASRLFVQQMLFIVGRLLQVVCLCSKCYLLLAVCYNWNY